MADSLDFSIVVPTYNRPRRLRGLLRCLSRQAYPRDRFEIVIVDDGGLAPLDEVVADAAGAKYGGGGESWAVVGVDR